MSIDFDSLTDVLNHPVRRKIILALYEKKGLSYVELMNLVEVANTGKFNYHLKILGDLIAKDQEGKYRLTEKGHMAALLLQKFPEKKGEPKPLNMSDAIIIGFVGFVLIFVNPVFWISYFADLIIHELTVPSVLFFVAIGFSTFLYALIVPGGVMWLLTTRRVNSHDIYDLLKPPFTAFILVLVVLILMLLRGVNLTLTLKTPPTIINPPAQIPNGGIQYYTTYSMTSMNLQTTLFQGLILAFMGVLIAEIAHKLRKKSPADKTAKGKGVL